MVLLPKNRPPIHGGELLEELIEDFGLTQTRLAELTGMPFPRVNQIIRGKRRITPDSALRLARLFNTTPDMWLNYQQAWDLWETARQSGAKIDKVKPLPEAVEAALAETRGGAARDLGARAEYRRAAHAAAGFRHSGGSRRSRSAPKMVQATATAKSAGRRGRGASAGRDG